ncbi:MAG: hypothetical protein CMJ64_11050 [Planctomycetaceae bacterium]|nr:hypothetical protein [Planctomycetaceae bacterium]
MLGSFDCIFVSSQAHQNLRTSRVNLRDAWGTRRELVDQAERFDEITLHHRVDGQVMKCSFVTGLTFENLTPQHDCVFPAFKQPQRRCNAV